MLALTRKLDEVIEIVVPGRSRSIKLRILRIGCNRVKLGIEADSEVQITRPESPVANRRAMTATA